MIAPRFGRLALDIQTHDLNEQDKHYKDLRRGFNWLGGATVIAKLIDSATILLVLLFLTKEQVGTASLVVSVGAVVESMSVLGTGEALLQAKSVSRLRLDSLFWFVIGMASLVAVVVLIAAPWIQLLYGASGLAVYFIVIALKQPIVGATLVSLTMMNRALQFERIAIVNTCATFAAALTRLGLAVGGAGAWALVVGFAAHGLYMLIGTQIAKPFVPKLRFRWREVSPLVHFGVRAFTWNLMHQLIRNIDFMLVGWFYGLSQLAIYRVAFDIAMEPAVAVGAVVNRTAFPVFARIAEAKEHLRQVFNWSTRRIAVLVSPLMVALILAADPLTALIHDGQGHSYAAAALPLQLLAAAALLRVNLQLIDPLLLATGRPGTAMRLSAATLLLLSVGILVAGLHFQGRAGVIAVSAVWLAVYPLLLTWSVRYIHRTLEIGIANLASNFIAPAVGAAVLIMIVELCRIWMPSDALELQLGIVVVATAIAYAGIFRYVRQPIEAISRSVEGRD